MLQEWMWALSGVSATAIIGAFIAYWYFQHQKRNWNLTISNAEQRAQTATDQLNKQEANFKLELATERAQHAEVLKNEREQTIIDYKNRLNQNKSEWQSKLALQQAEQETLTLQRLKAADLDWQKRLEEVQKELETSRATIHSINLKKAEDETAMQQRIIEIEQGWQDKITVLQNQYETIRTQVHTMNIEHADEVVQKIRQYETLVQQEGIERRLATDQAYKRGFDEGSQHFQVQIRPYVRKHIKKGAIWSDYYYGVGYQYQLMVKGIPCFAPNIIIEREEKVTEFNEKSLNKFLECAMQIVNTIVKEKGTSLPVAKDDTPVITESTSG